MNGRRPYPPTSGERTMDQWYRCRCTPVRGGGVQGPGGWSPGRRGPRDRCQGPQPRGRPALPRSGRPPRPVKIEGGGRGSPKQWVTGSTGSVPRESVRRKSHHGRVEVDRRDRGGLSRRRGPGIEPPLASGIEVLEVDGGTREDPSSDPDTPSDRVVSPP